MKVIATNKLFQDEKDKTFYIGKILEKIECHYLQVYPFLTDHEFYSLFGEKVINAISSLNCPREKCGLCDIEINCPFYSKRLDKCGIDKYKPVHCRLWHCYRCGPKEVVEQLRELTSLLADQIGFKKEAQEIKQSLEKGDITEKEAKTKYIRLIEGYRRANDF